MSTTEPVQPAPLKLPILGILETPQGTISQANIEALAKQAILVVQLQNIENIRLIEIPQQP